MGGHWTTRKKVAKKRNNVKVILPGNLPCARNSNRRGKVLREE
jgi:hypothetical protein